MRAVGRPLRWSLFGPMRRCQAALLRATLAFQTLRGARIATEGHCWRPRSRGHALDEASSADLSRIDRRYRAHGNDAAQGTLPQTERFMLKALGAADSPTQGFESVRVARGTTVSVDQDKWGSTSTT